MSSLKIKVNFYLLLLAIIFFNKLVQVSSLQCKGEQNEDVDWFVLYKIPKISDNNNLLIKEGVAYLYMDNNSFQNGWTLSTNSISSKNSIPAYTLAPFYDNENYKNLWLLYNDQPPNEPAKVFDGHTKGAVIANKNEGFWLIHSVPHFPPAPNIEYKFNRSKIERNIKETENLHTVNISVGEYSFPSSGKINGQSLLCISTNQITFNNIGKQLMYNEIIVFKKNIPDHLLKQYNILADAANKVHVTSEPYNNKINIYSKAGEEFVSFAKSSKWQKDLYEDFVAPQLDTDLYAETWLNGRGRLPSDCNKSRVLNIESISLPIAKVNFKNSRDHSKWAISIEGKKNSWVCIGDINRALTQFERGGGTVCLNLPEVWISYKDSVSNVEPCPKENSKKFFDKLKSWYNLFVS